MKTKTCAMCGEDKPADGSHFPPLKRSADGLQSYCKPCNKVYQRAYWKRRKEEGTLGNGVAQCEFCDVELPRKNINFFRVCGDQYKACDDCKEYFDNGELEQPESNYTSQIDNSCVATFYDEDDRYQGRYSDEIQALHVEAMKSQGLYRHLREGDEGFDEVVKEIMGGV